jgi:hypothetical protein
MKHIPFLDRMFAGSETTHGPGSLLLSATSLTAFG